MHSSYAVSATPSNARLLIRLKNDTNNSNIVITDEITELAKQDKMDASDFAGFEFSLKERNDIQTMVDYGMRLTVSPNSLDAQLPKLKCAARYLKCDVLFGQFNGALKRTDMPCIDITTLYESSVKEKHRTNIILFPYNYNSGIQMDVYYSYERLVIVTNDRALKAPWGDEFTFNKISLSNNIHSMKWINREFNG